MASPEAAFAAGLAAIPDVPAAQQKEALEGRAPRAPPRRDKEPAAERKGAKSKNETLKDGAADAATMRSKRLMLEQISAYARVFRDRLTVPPQRLTMENSLEEISAELESLTTSINGFGVDDTIRTVLVHTAGLMESLPGIAAPGYQRMIQLTLPVEDDAVKQLAIKYGRYLSVGPEAKIALHFVKVLGECRRLSRDPAWMSLTAEQREDVIRRGAQEVASGVPVTPVQSSATAPAGAGVGAPETNGIH